MVSNITFLSQANVNFSGANKTETKPALELKQQPTGDIVSFSGPSIKNTSDMMKDYYPQEHAMKIISKIGSDNVKTITDFVADGEPKTEAQINNLLEKVSSKLEPEEKDTLKTIITKASENISKLSDEEKLKLKEDCKKLEEITQKVVPENKDKLGCMILGLMFFCGSAPTAPLLYGLGLFGVGLATVAAFATVQPSDKTKLGDLIKTFLGCLAVEGGIA